jgi:hypothetical protein
VALNLFGVTVNDAHTASVHVDDIQTITVRDLAAICGTTEYRELAIDDAAIEHHRDVISAYALRGPVLPAPTGVVFKSQEAMLSWLELHSGALSEALSFVENRVAGRVHISRNTTQDAQVAAVDIDGVAAESLRVLRTAAVATLPLRADRSAGIVMTAAFLVEQDLWGQFKAEVDALAKRSTGVAFAVTGPWPPYDFVQMQLGS